MDTQNIQQPLNQFKRAVEQKIKIDTMIIFGSYASGTARPDSDIDVIVVSEQFKNMDEDTRLSILYKASQFIRPEIQPWGFTSEELKKKSTLTLVGYARDTGIPFV